MKSGTHGNVATSALAGKLDPLLSACVGGTRSTWQHTCGAATNIRASEEGERTQVIHIGK